MDAGWIFFICYAVLMVVAAIVGGAILAHEELERERHEKEKRFEKKVEALRRLIKKPMNENKGETE